MSASSPEHQSYSPHHHHCYEEENEAAAANTDTTESPFVSWRRLRNNPRFIQAVTEFCDWEAECRYEMALEYASWWPSHVRDFRFELLIIVERDICVELLIEREGRKQILMEEEEEFWNLEDYWYHKQTFAFWPRWIEFAHSVLSARMWTLESLIRNEFTHRMQIIDRDEIKEREAIIETVQTQARTLNLEWGDFVPPKIQKQREEDAARQREIIEAQEKDVEILKELYYRQIVQVLQQKWEDLMTAWEAGRLRIMWNSEQNFDGIVERYFPSGMMGEETAVSDDGDE